MRLRVLSRSGSSDSENLGVFGEAEGRFVVRKLVWEGMGWSSSVWGFCVL